MKKQELQQLQAFSRGLNAHAIIAQTDLRGKITFVNDRFCEISGYSREELLGKDHRIVNSGFHSKEFFKNLWDTIHSGQVWRGEIKNKSKNGGDYWVDTTITPLLDSSGAITGFISFRYDVTEKKLAEEALKASESKMRQLFMQSQDASMILTPPTWKFTHCNQATLKLFKVASEEEFLRMGPWSLSPELQSDGRRSDDKAKEYIMRALETGSAYFEWTHCNTQGEEIPCTVMLSRIEDSDHTYLHAVVRDISLKKTLEKELLQSKQTLSIALDGARLGIWEWDLTNNKVQFDHRTAKMFGLRFDEIHMDLKKWETRIHWEDLNLCRQAIRNHLQGKTDLYENIHRVRHNDGHWVYVMDRGHVSEKGPDGQPTKFTGTYLDISELEHTKQKLSLLYDNSPFGFAFCDMDGNIIDVNKKYEEITGYSLKELKTLSYWDITPKMYELDEQKQLDSLEKIGQYGPYRKEYITKDGARIPVELNGFIIRDFDGQGGIWSIVEDISEKVEAEAEYERQKAIAHHQSKLASIGEMAAGIGHEINNPLAIIRGYITSIKKAASKDKPLNMENLYDKLNKIDVAAIRIAHIVQGLRTFSRSDTTSLSDFDPIEALQESFDMVSEIYQKNGINMVFENPCILSPITVYGNRGKFQQIIMNLLANARDAVDGKTDKKVHIFCVLNKQNLQIIIKDNGSGIPDNIAQKIFDPFFTTKDVNKGTGIGLSLVHSIIQEMKGHIHFDSTENLGTIFFLDFPVKPVEEIMTNQQEQVPDPRVINTKISAKALLVDDEESIRVLLSETLKDMGLTVTTAENGCEAWDLYSKNPEEYDIILSDMKMPKMDGPDLVKKIRSSKDLKQPKILLFTGGIRRNFEDQKNDWVSMIDGYFVKPFDEDKLFELLSNCFPQISKNEVA